MVTILSDLFQKTPFSIPFLNRVQLNENLDVESVKKWGEEEERKAKHFT